MTEIPVAGTNGTGNSLIWDVIEARPNRLYVSANPGSGGFAWIAIVKLDQGNAISRIDSGGIIRARPVFEASPEQQFLYVGAGFSPESLYKFDISTDTPPLVLEDDHGSISGTSQFEISPDGNFVYLTSGQVLRASDFTQAAGIPAGSSRISNDGNLIFIGRVANNSQILVYDRVALVELRRHQTTCQPRRIRALPDDAGILVLGNTSICRVAFGPVELATATPTPSPTGTPTPTPSDTPTAVPEARCADVDISGRVNMQDTMMVYRAIVRGIGDSWFDVSGDGRVDVRDIWETLAQRGRRC